MFFKMYIYAESATNILYCLFHGQELWLQDMGVEMIMTSLIVMFNFALAKLLLPVPIMLGFCLVILNSKREHGNSSIKLEAETTT